MRHERCTTPFHDLLDVGVSAIQLREKALTDAEYIRLAEPLCKLCHAYSAQLFINSRIEIAREVGADGLHLPGDSVSVGKSDRGDQSPLHHRPALSIR